MNYWIDELKLKFEI